MSKRPLKALFLDVDDTIYSITDFVKVARRNAMEAMIKAGLNIELEEGLRELDEVVREFGSNHANHYDKLLRRLPPELYANANPLIIKIAGVVAYHQTKNWSLAPYGDAIEVLNDLKRKGLKLGIITAGIDVKQAEKIYRLGLHEIVEGRYIYITESVGIAKNNPKIFLKACREIGANPSECMYIGDNPPVDIDVPARIGMATILSRRGGKYIEVVGETTPMHTVDNFYDVADIINEHYEIIK